MIHEMKWHNKERLTLKKWASYSSSYERLGTFITNTNSCILLYSQKVSVLQNAPMYFYKAVHIKERETSVFEVTLPILVEFVDQFADGRYIFAKSRTFYMEGPNIFITNSMGEITSRIVAGDGIAHLQIDDKDQIWIGYSVENKRNQNAWPSSISIGRHGFVVFDKEGKILWNPKNLEIMHTESMNITKDYYVIVAHSYLQLIHIFEHDYYMSFECNNQIIRQITMSEEQTLIILDDKNELKRLVMDGHQYIAAQLIELIDEDGKTLKGEIKIRNNAIFCFAGDDIYRVTNV